jgi:hypothetical protein
MEPPLAQMTMRGKWADGIEPRHFKWIVTDRLAISERPGGYGSQHRRVRRMEEIIWIRQQSFNWVISLIEAPHNLHNYDEQGVPYLHWPVQSTDLDGLALIYNELHTLLESGRKILVHHEELGDRLCGFIAGYLVWSGLIDASPRAITVVEQITQRQLGPAGREFVSSATSVAAAS